jgi:hypothetical protein
MAINEQCIGVTIGVFYDMGIPYFLKKCFGCGHPDNYNCLFGMPFNNKTALFGCGFNR